MRELLSDLLAETAEHFGHFFSVGTGGGDSVLGTLELGRRNHLHGFSDLLCVFYRLDSSAHVQKAWHRFNNLWFGKVYDCVSS